MVHAIQDMVPKIHQSAFVAWNAEVAGSVTLAKDVSVWFSVTLRADIAPIEIGEGSNIQDGSVVHVDTEAPTIVGRNVTVGHRAILHSCTIGDDALIGMGAIILNGAEIGSESIVGAGALVTQGKKFPPRSLILGSPAKLVRELSSEEIASIKQNAEHYKELARIAKEQYIEE
ncbi:gamma carbonic anhydrase family protein [Gracilinema caldarium]|uniref:gamma carbonic anhydrase family protein n=1 Tax=Gracilinema caldarium TaxID=215591 RepID=UPI0026EFE086|nr:gamma carbonic anhydrase family protein [Gracilinema caldarium]